MEAAKHTTSGSGTSYFSHIPEIKYEGPSSQNPFAFKYYNANEVILGKPMKDWLRFSVCYWHTWRGYQIIHFLKILLILIYYNN